MNFDAFKCMSFVFESDREREREQENDDKFVFIALHANILSNFKLNRRQAKG